MKVERRADLDFVRVAAVAVLVVYHVSLVYGTQAYVFKATNQYPIIDLVATATHPWRMSLLFFISGVATAFISTKMSATRLRETRSRKLLVPLLLGMLFLVPPQVYVAVVTKVDSSVQFGEVLWRYFTLQTVQMPDGTASGLIDFYHLWYLAYLWLYTAILTVLLRRSPTFVRRLAGQVSKQMTGTRLLLFPIAYMFFARAFLQPMFNESLKITNDWYCHAVYFAVFCLGFLLGRDEKFWDNVCHCRWLALTLAVSGTAALYADHLHPAFMEDHGLGALVYGTVQWSSIIAILGFARIHVRSRSRLLSYLNGGVLTYYVLHQPVILLFAYWLNRNGWENAFSPLLVLLYTIIFCLLAYDMKLRFQDAFMPARQG